MLVMPKIATPSQCKTLANHPSWKDDPAAHGAVPKGTAPFYRLITDALFGNTLH